MNAKTDSSNRARRRRGFTLVELLISVILMALLGVAMAGAAFIGARSYETTRNVSRLSQSGRLILERISREIRSAQSVTCAENLLVIVPADTSSGLTEIRYFLDGGTFTCRRSEGAGQQDYPLLRTQDGVWVSQFTVTITTSLQGEQYVTSLVTVRLNLSTLDESLSLTASAAPRQNLSF